MGRLGMPPKNVTGYRSGVHASELPGAGDDQLNPPSVTPEPAPSDDQLLKMAVVSAVAGAIITLLVMRWVRRNLSITRRVV